MNPLRTLDPNLYTNETEVPWKPQKCVWALRSAYIAENS